MSYLSGQNTQSKSFRSNERGAIMLEVIAVLALMGVMGAMLFRQIYQRNQELHNIQMASEIRSVKEGFSAYIQANRAQILSACGRADPDLGEVRQCGTSPDTGFTSLNLAASIKPYLPDGWFAETSGNPAGTDLNGFYDFKLFTFTQNDVTKRRMLYGVVIPKKTTLPVTGWNFKRAARVALLIGADGGAFDREITKDGRRPVVSGSLGSWSLVAQNIIDGQNNEASCSCNNTSCDSSCKPTYAAITGLDIFAPEYELPSVDVNLRASWDLVLGKLAAKDYFSVGGDTCYTISHTGTNPADHLVASDTIQNAGSSTCQPLFWVGTGGTEGVRDGNVYVQKDLRVGVTPGDTKGAIRLDDSGVIVMEKATVSDPQTSGNNVTYLLDPKYTSVMNDIKIMSRGGAKLSDILPKYILKDVKQYQKTINANTTGTVLKITKPSCPSGYGQAVVLIPQNFGGQLGYKPNNNTGTTDSHYHSISTTSIQLQIDSTNAGGLGSVITTDPTGSVWSITVKFANTPKAAETMRFIAQTYCVWTGSAGVTTRKAGDAASLAQVKTAEECRSYGGAWDTTSNTCS